MKKIQAITIITSYTIFAAIMVFQVFGRIYGNAGRMDNIYLFLEIFCIFSPIIYVFVIIFWKKPNKWIFYILLPYLISQLLYFCVMIVGDELSLFLKEPIKFQIPYLLFIPYIFTFIWVLSLFMLSFDYCLTRIWHRKTNSGVKQPHY